MNWQSKVEAASAAHTQEAEMVSLSMGIRNDAAPLQILLATLLCRPSVTKVFEDNEARITAARKGYSPSLRHLPRRQRCALGTVHETFYEDEDATTEEVETRRLLVEKWGSMELIHCETKKHKGDFFTKELPRGEVETAIAAMGIINCGKIAMCARRP